MGTGRHNAHSTHRRELLPGGLRGTRGGSCYDHCSTARFDLTWRLQNTLGSPPAVT